jgi:hypothetical protein
MTQLLITLSTQLNFLCCTFFIVKSLKKSKPFSQLKEECHVLLILTNHLLKTCYTKVSSIRYTCQSNTTRV